MAILSTEQASNILLACRGVYYACLDAVVDRASEPGTAIIITALCERIYERALADFREGMAKDFERKFSKARKRTGNDDLEGLARREQG
jgi:hypothetical protein